MSQPITLVTRPHGEESVSRTMMLVILALSPATLFGLYQFGWPAINLFLITVFTAVAAEAVMLKLRNRPIKLHLMDGSALVTGWLLAMTLPPWAPWWIGVLGSLFAIVLAKQLYGGLGQNLFNPAMVGRVILLVSFPLEMTLFITPQSIFSADAPGFLEGVQITFGSITDAQHHWDQFSSATLLSHLSIELNRGETIPTAMAHYYQPWELFAGFVPGSLAETSGLLILLGGLFLLQKRVISWHIPVSMLGTLIVLATVGNLIAPETHPNALVHLVSGATLIGAFFILTDPVGSPASLRGQIIFGIGAGVLLYVVRTWASYPEGMGFIVLLMNATTPLIDHFIKPRVYGEVKKEVSR